MKPHVPPKLKKLPSSKQQRMDDLLERNREGVITTAEKAKLQALVAEAEQLMVENAKRLAAFHEQETIEAPSGATPVTVWVKAVPVGR
jgi:hypothetical protein